MPSKIIKDKPNKKNNEIFTISFKEFGINLNKKKIHQKIIQLTNAIKILQKIVNLIKNRPMTSHIYSVMHKIIKDMEILKKKLDFFKNRL
ncbi:hypothetical protein QJ854_gp025 [Moumouvirus goulette]|uniref:Uncharacterized protein n=1 Tax=Moumouvirus goulette TaxID=1247379 RepID=M1PY97_9VIRU|nr:hypothetical protein QJ854_gp025 [Moumouvirus goulette]AGF85757.1 hypothetical protein glt_00954 [Moumouvirus goulette]